MIKKGNLRIDIQGEKVVIFCQTENQAKQVKLGIEKVLFSRMGRLAIKKTMKEVENEE